MAAYLTVAEWKDATMMPTGTVVALEAKRAGYIQKRLDFRSAEIDARLRKRYAAPFSAPVPVVVQLWLAALVTLDAYRAMGFDPSSEQDSTIIDDANDAHAAIREAADAKDGLYDLPLREEAETSGIIRGRPLMRADKTPYESIVRNRRARAGEVQFDGD